MFLIDTHCHLNAEYYPDGLGEVFERMKANGVGMAVLASVDIASSKEALEILNNARDGIKMYAIAGVHPHEAEKAPENYISELEDIAKNDKVIAIGEIGLDYFYDISPRDAQRRVFEEQIELAKKLRKPMVIHVRDAAEREKGPANRELLNIMKTHNAESAGGVIHCFSGAREDADEALAMGFYISFAGPITYPRNRALREIASIVPEDRILCETDSPYLAPQGFRGTTNEPCHVRLVYEYIAMLKGMSTESFACAVKENTERAFHIAVR